jgi:hypothetical protein
MAATKPPDQKPRAGCSHGCGDQPRSQPSDQPSHDLLARVKELGDASRFDLMRSCGYVSVKKDGCERLNFMVFYEALLVA